MWHAGFSFFKTRLKACLHGCGGPRIGVVIRLVVVKKWPAFAYSLEDPCENTSQVDNSEKPFCLEFLRALLL